MSKAKKTKRAPLRHAVHWGSRVLPMAGKLGIILIAIVALGLMFSALQALGSAALRIALTLLIASGMLLMCYSEGLTRGLGDAQASRLYENMCTQGHTPTARDDSMCYHPLKAVSACGVLFFIPMAIAIYLALTAKPYTYVLQDLPAWLTDTYGSRSDIMAPLGAYAVQKGLELVDWLRMAVRLLELIFVNLFSDPQTMAQTIDRLSPLFLCTYPAAYLIGYLRGPGQLHQQSVMQKRAQKAAVRKAKRNKVAGELLGSRESVHYGQKPQTEQHKKKELI